MSGEAVIVSSLSAGAIGAAFAVAGLMAVGSVAYMMAKEHQHQRRAAAEHKAAEQKKQLAAWQAYQDAQQQAMQRLNEEQQMARDAFANLRLHLQEASHQQDDEPPQAGAQAQVFLDADEPGQVQQRLTRLQDWLNELSPQLINHETSPIPRLQTQLEQLSSQLPPLESVEYFIDTAKRSVQQLIRNLDEQEQQQAQALQQAESQLDELLRYQQLAEAGIEAEEAAALQAHLLAVLAAQDTKLISLDSLALLQKKSADLKKGIEQRLEQQAAEAAVYQCVHQRMQAMGYAAAQQEGDRVYSWTIPGGEQVRFVLQADFRLSFQVAHERTHHTDAPLSLEEKAFLHQQEGRWCKDLPKLLKQLQADGLNYQVDFERQLPDDGIPVVILETADELLAAEAEETARLQQHSSVKRYLES